MRRRDFLRGLLGAGIATAATPAIVEPVRKLWFVPSNAPVGSRVERLSAWEPMPSHAAYRNTRTGDVISYDFWHNTRNDEVRQRVVMYQSDGVEHEVDVTAADLRSMGVDPGPFMLREQRTREVVSYADAARYAFEVGRRPGKSIAAGRTREELAAMYPEPTGTLFGIDAQASPGWKAQRYTQTDAARLFRELTLSYANPETVTGGCDRSRT